jgi:hypothetical protein
MSARAVTLSVVAAAGVALLLYRRHERQRAAGGQHLNVDACRALGIPLTAKHTALVYFRGAW